MQHVNLVTLVIVFHVQQAPMIPLFYRQTLKILRRVSDLVVQVILSQATLNKNNALRVNHNALLVDLEDHLLMLQYA